MAEETPLFYVLTRTSGRPSYFHRNREMLCSQSHPNWYHIISNDDVITNTYLSRDFGKNTQVVNFTRVPRESYNHFPYNDYINTMHKKILERDKQGWVIYLDDDDYFADSCSLQRIASHVKDLPKDGLLLWQVQYPQGVLKPSSKLVRQRRLKANSQPSNSYCFHTSILEKFPRELYWDDRKGGDRRFLNRLYRLSSKKKWLEEVLTVVRPDSSDGQGKGYRDCDRCSLDD